MTRKLISCVLILLSLLAGHAAAAQEKVEIRKVADGVYVALPPTALRFDDATSTIILLDEGVLVVDTQVTPVNSAAIIAEIRKLTTKPVRYVVNTHWHGDHVQGNSAYRDAFPDVLFIAHVNTRADIEARAIPSWKEDVEGIPAQLQKAEENLAKGLGMRGQPLSAEEQKLQRGRIDRGRAQLARLQEVKEFVLPTLTFEDSLTLIRGGREIRMRHFAGHTRGDIVLYLPAEKILISGDLLDDMPYTGHGSPAALVATLKELSKLDFEWIIPGHGIPKQGREHLEKILGLFESIVAQVQECARAGLSLEDTRKKVDLEKFRAYFTPDEVAGRYWNGFMPAAIERAYNEATGKKLD
jgi:glyoxylase-like metal-dependent hydrolase (beta-lactamase superfamily II)